MRRVRGCPPFRDLFVLTASGTEESRVMRMCVRLRRTLESWFADPAYQSMDVQLLGPAPASVAKVNNRYRYRLTISGHNSKTMRALVAALLCAAHNDKEMRGVSVFADVNPMD